MDPNSGEYVSFIKNVLGVHLDQLLRKHRDGHLFPEIMEGHIAEIDIVENDLQKLKEMFEAKHEHMLATMERRAEYQEQLVWEKQNNASLTKKVEHQKGEIAELKRQLAEAQTSIAADTQKHDRLVESMRELLLLERQKFEALQKCHPPPPLPPPPQPARRETPSGKMAEIMERFQIVMQGCTSLVSQQAFLYFNSMRSAPDYAAQDVAVYEGRFMSEVNALGNTLGSFCKHMGCPPLSGDINTSVNFAL
jgi:uncharacterized coiled-coil protein SlyX